LASGTSLDDVFINCPFDDKYAPIFRALIFVVIACGFRPRSAREVDDGGEARIEKLIKIIEECRYGIHDISRTQLDKTTKLPRFNMPLELGIFLGAKRFGDRAQKQKRLLIFDTKQYRYQKFISDLAGMDIHAHNGDPLRAISETRDWLANVSRRQLIGGGQVIAIYKRFCAQLPAMRQKAGLPKKIPYAEFERLIVGWLK
jgi:hypothetical protein